WRDPAGAQSSRPSSCATTGRARHEAGVYLLSHSFETGGLAISENESLHSGQVIADLSPRCCAKGSKSRSAYSKGQAFSMHQVAMMVSMVFRTVTPRARSTR